jgi:hypothetical protein
MTPLQVLLAGLAFIVIFLLIALPLAQIGGRLFKVLDKYADSGITLAICMVAYGCMTGLIIVITFVAICQNFC